jgi:tetratricopeptide (TPR) repeat protein
VLEAQRTPESRRRAIATLESLAGRNLANPVDRLLLARLEEAVGDWPKAREQYRELILRTESPRDLETLIRRPGYLYRFGEALLRHHQPGPDQDLAEVQELVGQLKKLQPDSAMTAVLEVEFLRAGQRLEEAAARIRSLAERPNLTPAFRTTLAGLAEKIGRPDLAEPLWRRNAAESADGTGKIALAQFLGRQGRVRDALDLLEPLWAEPRRRDLVGAVAITILFPSERPAAKPDPAQVERVVRWLEPEVAAKNPRAATMLANLFERLGNYAKAEEYYRKAIALNEREGVALNNLAWLTALNGGPKGDARGALNLINQAIQLRGPLPDFLDTRGIVYLAGGEDRLAIADLENAAAAAPSAAKYFHLTQAYLKVNDKEKARKNLEAAKSLGLPSGLHQLELRSYRQVLSALEAP